MTGTTNMAGAPAERWATALERRRAACKQVVCGCGCGKAFLLFCTGDPAVDGYIVLSAAKCRETAAWFEAQADRLVGRKPS